MTRIVALVVLLVAAVEVRAQEILWTPSPNAIPCLTCMVQPTDPAGMFTVCRLFDVDIAPGSRFGACIHTQDGGHYGEEPGHIDVELRKPPQNWFTNTIVIHPVPGYNFECIGWSDRPADGACGHEAVWECQAVEAPPYQGW